MGPKHLCNPPGDLPIQNLTIAQNEKPELLVLVNGDYICVCFITIIEILKRKEKKEKYYT